MKTHVPSNFIWLNITQAIGSFMDNLFKMLTVFYLADALGLPLERTLAISTVLLVVPFIFLSNLAGALADRYSKTKLIHIVKWAELALIALSFPAYFSGRAWPMLTVLTLLACQSAFFGPLKRGIIPEIVPEEAVAEANGLLSATSYIGIIVGMVLPSVLCARFGMPYWGVLALASVVSAVGIAASYGIPATAPQRRPMRPSWRVVTDTVSVFRAVRPRRMLFQAALGAAAFSGLAALFQQALVIFARNELGMTIKEAGFPFFFVAAKAFAIVGGMPTASKLTSAPLPPVSAITSFTISASFPKQCVAPDSRAAASFSSAISDTMIRAALEFFSVLITICPIVPAPSTSAVSPTMIGVMLTAWNPIDRGSTSAAISKETSSGSA